MKQILRKLYKPFTKKLRKALTLPHHFFYPEAGLPNPWDFVELETRRRLHEYMKVSAECIKTIFIVGANTGEEVEPLKSNYNNAKFYCYEPSPRYFSGLASNHANKSYVVTRNIALSDQEGELDFYELPMPGNGSLLKPDPEKWQRLTKWPENKVENFKVHSSTLDIEAADIQEIDLLWIDVQGAEFQVLKGGAQTLHKTKSIIFDGSCHNITL